MTHARITIAALVALAGTCAAQTCDWNTADGNWSNPANWDPQDVPDAAGESGRISIGGVYTVTLDMSPTIEWLDISNADATLLLPGATLTLLHPAGLTNDGTVRNIVGSTIVGNITNNGLFSLRGYNQALRLDGPTVTNHGTIMVNPEHSGYWADLIFSADTTLDGTGLVQLDYSSAYMSTAGGATVTQGAEHRISGRGVLQAALVNDGTVEADVNGETMLLSGFTKLNHNLMRALDRGTLLAEGVTIDQAGGGTMRAEDDSIVRLTNATIIGGSLDSAGAGIVQHHGGHSTLTGVTNLGQLNLVGYNLYTYINGAGLTNNGSIVVNSDQSGYFARVYYTENGDLNGTGTMTLNYSSASLDSADGVTVCHGPGHTIDGAGHIAAALDNAGQIRATQTDNELVLDGRAKTNRTAMLAAEGATLRLLGTVIDQSPGGTIRAEDASRVVLQNAVVIGGTLDSAGSGFVEHRDGHSTLRGVTNLGQLNLIGYNLYTYIDGDGLTNDGRIVVNSNQSGYFAKVYYAESGSLGGVGTMTLNYQSASLESAPGVTITHGPDHTIDGDGHLSAALNNHGVIVANHSGVELVADGYRKANSAALKASGGGTLRVAATIDQTGGGTIAAEDASVAILADAVIIGGTLDSAGTGYLEHRDGHSTLQGVTNRGLLNLRGYNLYTYITGGGLINDGDIVVNWNDSGYYARVYYPEDGVLGGSGTLTLYAHSSSAGLQTAADVTCTIGPDQTVTGRGILSGAFVNHGTLAPGLAVGTLLAEGVLTMADDALLDVQISSTGSYDTLDGSAILTVNGTVGVEFVDGYEPVFGHQFTIIRGQSVGGEFDTITGPTLPGALVYRVRYEPTSAVLVITCPADTNADAQINTLDFLYFLNLWTAQDPEADWNHDGHINTLDFLAYLNEWVAGC